MTPTKEQAVEAAKPVTDYRGYCQMCGEPDVITRHNLKQPTPPPDAALREFVRKCRNFSPSDDYRAGTIDSPFQWDESEDVLTSELSAKVRAGSVTGEVRQVIVDLLSIVRIQNGNLHADINTIQDRARTILDAGQTDEPKTR